MAINVQALPWVEELGAVRAPTLPRLPTLGVVLSADLLALALPASLARQLDWRGALFALLAVIILAMHGHYRQRIAPSLARETPALVGCVAVAAFVIGLVPGSPASADLLPRAAAVGIVLLLLGRALVYTGIRTIRARAVLEPTLIIGAGTVGAEVARTLQDHPEYGLVPVGFLDSFDNPGDLPVPLLGTPASLDVVLREYEVRRVIIAFGGMRDAEMVPLVRACDRASVDIHVLPRFFELGTAPDAGSIDDIWGMPVLRLGRPTLKPAAWRMKRAFDLLVASTCVALSAPLFVLIALAVKLTSRGPVFFRQKRVGQHGRVVDILKFRSMRDNSVDHDTDWYTDDDVRTTRIGRFLRRTSLDELPQLINVVKGEMSLVGPRPERPFFVSQFQTEVPRYGDRHRVPVGMTGWAQVHGLRGDTSIAQRARFDNQYIENWSVWKDVVILARTIRAVGKTAASG